MYCIGYGGMEQIHREITISGKINAIAFHVYCTGHRCKPFTHVTSRETILLCHPPLSPSSTNLHFALRQMPPKRKHNNCSQDDGSKDLPSKTVNLGSRSLHSDLGSYWSSQPTRKRRTTQHDITEDRPMANTQPQGMPRKTLKHGSKALHSDLGGYWSTTTPRKRSTTQNDVMEDSPMTDAPANTMPATQSASAQKNGNDTAADMNGEASTDSHPLENPCDLPPPNGENTEPTEHSAATSMPMQEEREATPGH
jgi:hypothetical protein